jgi:leucyl/phenylalanyl-tRNA---protein transferase
MKGRMGQDDEFALTPDLILRAYAAGIFPMAESADDPGLHWIEPKTRGIIPLDSFHIPGKLARFVRNSPYQVVIDRDFDAVIAACAAPRSQTSETWINPPIRRLYRALFDAGHCHTVEVWDEDRLIGGLYGIALGGAFFGESMFHKVRDCSKLALVHLVARLKAGGFMLLDTQFITDHLRQFGAEEIPRKAYRKRLDLALYGNGNFLIWPKSRRITGHEALHVLAGGALAPS